MGSVIFNLYSTMWRQHLSIICSIDEEVKKRHDGKLEILYHSVQTEEVNFGRNPPKLRALNNNYVVLDSRLITLKKIYRVYPEFSRLNNVGVVKVPFFYNLFFSILFVTSLKTIYFKLENYLPLKYKWQCTWTEPPLSLFVSVFKSQVAKSHWKSGFKLSLLSLLCSAEV